jgi:phosphoglycolate phosphatase-like HAD superfamily hydrolase
MNHFFAFDFDGVVCNSAGESGLTAWQAAHALWPSRIGQVPDPEFVRRFPRLRPVIETGHENAVVVALVVQGIDDAQMLAEFPRLRDELMARENLDAQSLRRAFGEARDAWLKSDEAGWLDAQSFYPGVVEAINAMSAPRCIITTKEERFTRVLVARAGIEVDPQRIYALESFEGGGKRSVLQRLAREFPQHRLHFFEDRIATLEGLAGSDLAELYLVDWGYNTVADRERARAVPGITVLDAAGFHALLARDG